MLKTKDPLGDWSEPFLVLPGKGYIDPCPLWDDDGYAYVIHGYAKSRIGFKSSLGIFQITPDGERAISDDICSIPKDHTWTGAKIGMFSTSLEPYNNHGFIDFTSVLVAYK